MVCEQVSVDISINCCSFLLYKYMSSMQKT